MHSAPVDRDLAIRQIDAFLADRYAPREYPALLAQARRFRAERPFLGKALLDCTPIFANTLLKYRALLEGGADLAVGVSGQIPRDPAIVRFLEATPIPLLRAPDAPARPFDVILDCGGSRADLAPLAGVCELTRSGIYHYARAACPVVLVDASRIKEIETSVGTGDGFMRAMRQLGYDDWPARRVVLFGAGKVGRGIAYRCTREGASVTVVDPADLPAGSLHAAALLDGRDLAAVRAAVEACHCLVTATGIRGAMRPYGLGPLLRARTDIPVAAMGIEDEWLGGLPPERLLCRGAAVNFALDEPTLLRYIDPSMALSNQSAAALLRGTFPTPGIHTPPPAAARLCLDPVLACGLITDDIRALGLP